MDETGEVLFNWVAKIADVYKTSEKLKKYLGNMTKYEGKMKKYDEI